MDGSSQTKAFRSLFENAPLAYQSLDEDARVLLVNNAWLELLGYRREEVVGRPIADFLAPDSRAQLDERFPRFKSRGEIKNAEFELLHRAGSPVPVRISGRIDTDESGRFQRTHCILVDLREERAAHKALEESERKYRQIIELAHEGIWQIDADSRTVFVNSALAAMLGYEPDEMLGRHLFDFMDDRQREHIDEILDRREQDISEAHGFEFLRKDGQRLFVVMSTAPVVDENGEYQGAVAGMLDVSERRRQEEHLRTSAGHLHDAESLGGFGYWSWELDQPDVWSSPGLRRLFDIDAEDVFVGFDTLMGRVHAADRPGLERLLKERLQDGSPYTVRYRVVHDSGRELTLDVIGRPLRNDAGMVYALNGVVRDVTRELQQEESLYRSEKLLNETQRLTQMGSWILDLTTESSWWSEGMFLLHGRDAAAGAPDPDTFLTMIDEAGRARILERLGHDLQNCEPHEELYSIVRADGSERKILATSHPVRDEAGAVTALRGYAQDVTERLAAESERRGFEQQQLHRQKLESLGVMAGGLAHDFNNLLQAVLGNTHLALQDTPVGSAALHSLIEVENAARRASDLCRQLLAYAGKGRLVIEDCNLAQLIREMIEILDVTISKKAALELKLPDDAILVRADATQLNQVVLNLVTNAAEAITGNAGRIEVELTVEELSAAQLAARYPTAEMTAGRHAVLRVSDDGCGMDEEVKLRLFDPFFSTKFTGRGLGMAAVLGIVKRHNGGIGVESRPNAGTRIEVALPILRVEPPAIGVRAERSQADTAARPFAGLGVLMADDERIVLDLGVRMLERLGCTVFKAGDGEEAVAVYREHGTAIDMVILDLTMPRMDGHQALRLIRAQNPQACIVISSGFSGDIVSSSFGDEVPDAFLAKPYELGTLKDVLCGLVRK
jgi:PAS domain S-box-containing protein